MQNEPDGEENPWLHRYYRHEPLRMSQSAAHIHEDIVDLLPRLRRFARALNECGAGAREAARKFLASMIDPESRAEVERLIASANAKR